MKSADPGAEGSEDIDMTMMTMNAAQGPFARIAAALRVWQHRRETRAELNRLTERELSDIGLCRADIETLVQQSA